MNMPVDYKQYDPKWGTNKYATPQEKSTIKSAGCGPTAVANILAAIVNEAIDPLTCASWARMKGYKYTNQGTSYSFPEAIGKEYGVTIRRLNIANVYGNKTAAVHKEALAELQKGNWLIACMGKGIWTSSGHYITVYGCEKGNVYINDPASAAKNRAKNKWTTFISQVKYYWVVEVPEAIRLRGNTQVWRYDFADFVREVQMTIGDNIDENADAVSLARTVTINPAKKTNTTHNVVLPLQKLFRQLGYYSGTLDRVAGTKFQTAINEYQKNILGAAKTDGEITKAKSMWKKMLAI